MLKAVAFLAAASLAALACADPQWKTFRSDEGGFTILMPGKPVSGKQGVRATDRAVAVQVYSVRLENEAYTVSFANYDKFDNQGARAESALDATINGIVNNVKGTISESKGMTLSGNPGKAVKFTMPGGLSGRAQVFLAKGRIYQLFVIGAQARVSSADADKFFGSFRLIP